MNRLVFIALSILSISANAADDCKIKSSGVLFSPQQEEIRTILESKGYEVVEGDDRATYSLYTMVYSIDGYYELIHDRYGRNLVKPIKFAKSGAWVNLEKNGKNVFHDHSAAVVPFVGQDYFHGKNVNVRKLMRLMRKVPRCGEIDI